MDRFKTSCLQVMIFSNLAKVRVLCLPIDQVNKSLFMTADYMTTSIVYFLCNNV